MDVTSGRLSKGKREAISKVRTLALAVVSRTDRHSKEEGGGGKKMNLGLGMLWSRCWQDLPVETTSLSGKYNWNSGTQSHDQV